jgi:hypothetical protein
MISKFYVYGHFRPDGSLFYIGKGCDTRAWCRNKRPKEWQDEAGDSFEVCLLEGFDTDEDALEREKELIELFGLQKDGGILCNQLIGGGAPTEFRELWRSKISKAHAGKKLTPEHIAKMTLWPKGHIPWNAGKTTSEEAKAKMRAAKLGVKRGPYSEEHRRRISLGNTGKKRSADTCAKIGMAKRGTKLSEEHRMKISESNMGRVFSEETRRKISQAHIGRKYSAERCAQMSRIKTGTTHSEETKRKMAESQRIAWAKRKELQPC